MMASRTFSFSQACEYLSLSSAELTLIREQGLVVAQSKSGKQLYSKSNLDLLRALLSIAMGRNWSHATVAWYADLIFATEVGRSILLPILEDPSVPINLPVNWLETTYVDIVLNDLSENIESEDGPFVALLRSLVLVGEGKLWPDLETLKQTDLYPIIEYFEQRGIKIVDQGYVIARDAGFMILSVILVFTGVAPALSAELNQLIISLQPRLSSLLGSKVPTQRSEQTKIRNEALVAVDKLYASKSIEIHEPAKDWDEERGLLVVRKRTIMLRLKVPQDTSDAIVDNLIDLVRPYLGPFGARVIHLLYQIANDPPYWRNPIITISTNDLLDRLGHKRTSDGSHHSKNRARLRDVLNAAHLLEIVGEYTTYENGELTRKAFYKNVISLIGATFDPQESISISTEDLRTKGLPKTVQIRLGFYDGVRRPTGELGNQYVLVPYLLEQTKIARANHSATHERLRSYFLFRYRQTGMSSRVIAITRETALEKAGIKNKNAAQATVTLRKALENLVAEGVLESYSSPLPTKIDKSFEVVLSERAILKESADY